MDMIDTIKTLSRENPLWRLRTTAAEFIASNIGTDDRPLIVLPMRDVVVSGQKINGMKPTVCLTERKLMAVHMPLFTRNCTSWLRSEIVEISPFANRMFEFSTSGGQTVRIRGLIGEKCVIAMNQRLYDALTSKNG